MKAERRIPVADAAQFGKVAVLLGGHSAEREISLLSGAAVHEALLSRGVDAHQVDAAGDVVDELRAGAFDRAWIALPGRGGEDGTIQGLLEILGMPYTGSGVKGSAICMDKLRTKQLIEGAGLGTPAYRVIHSAGDFDSIIAELGFPMMIKPAAEGSSIGLTRVTEKSELATAFSAAAGYQCEVFAESWATGREYTAAVLQGEVLPLVRIDAANTFYDYDAKYFSDSTQYICPCGLDAGTEAELARMATEAFAAAGAEGWGRVDFMMNDQDQPLILEINTVPGMTSHSLVPMAAAAKGIGFEELVWRILETSFAGDMTADEPMEVADAG